MAQLVLYVYTAFFIGRVHELLPFLASMRIVFVLGLVSVVAALLTPWRAKNRVLMQREVRIVIALCVLAVIVTPLGVWPGGSWSFLTDIFSRILVFFFLVVALATSRRVIQRLLWSVLTGVALLGIFTVGGGVAVATVYGGRAYASSTYDPNDVSMIMVCALPLAAFAAVALRGVGRVLATAAAVVYVLATIMTLSRGGFIGLIVVSLLLLFRLGTAALGRRLVILGVVVTILATAAPARYWDVMSTIWSPRAGGEYLESGVFSRIALWEGGLNLFLDDPLTGAGIGMYEVAEGLSHGGRGKWSAAHNSFIQVAAELGILGLALFAALIVVSLRNARQAVRAAKSEVRLRPLAWIAVAVETSLYAYVVEGFALSQAYSPMLYFLIGIATALRLQVELRPQPVTPTAATAITRAPQPVAE